jgi:hypothetical protein
MSAKDLMNVKQRSKLNKHVLVMSHWKIENKKQAAEIVSEFEKFLIPQLEYVDGVTPELVSRFYTNFTEVKKNLYFDCRKREWQRSIRMMGMSKELTEKVRRCSQGEALLLVYTYTDSSLLFPLSALGTRPQVAVLLGGGLAPADTGGPQRS